jgi:hypothetical protein
VYNSLVLNTSQYCVTVTTIRFQYFNPKWSYNSHLAIMPYSLPLDTINFHFIFPLTLVPHVSGITQYLFFHVWSVSLNIVFSIHLEMCIKTSFLFMAELQPTVWIYHIWLIHSSVIGLLACSSFDYCAYAARNIGVQISESLL